MKTRPVPYLTLWILAAGLTFGGAFSAGAEGAVSPTRNMQAEGPAVQGPIVMGRSVALRRKTKLHHVKTKPAAVTASYLERNADAE
jgi:hypothetical protein